MMAKFSTPYPCETVDISNPQNYREQWWKYTTNRRSYGRIY